MKKELWFGFSLMAIIVLACLILMPWANMTNGHLGLLMLALVVVAIMLGFPTAFTLMGMGMIFCFFAYWEANKGHAEKAGQLTLDLMVQKAYGVMTNEVLLSIPLFVFMGYLVERANLIEKLFKSLHLALARLPGSLAVATLVTCAIFATATGIVGAVVTLMGLLALPAMLRAGYDVRLSAGAITAGGCLGILIPPSVMLIVYGATAGVSVVKLYAGAFFPGIMLAALYIGYVMAVAKLKPHLAPPLSDADRKVDVPEATLAVVAGPKQNALSGLLRATKAKGDRPMARAHLRRQWLLMVLPALAIAIVMGLSWNAITKPNSVDDVSGMQQMGDTKMETSAADVASAAEPPGAAVPAAREAAPVSTKSAAIGGLQEPPGSAPEPLGGVKAPPAASLKEPPGASLKEPPGSSLKEPPGSSLEQPPAALSEPADSGSKEPPGSSLKEPPGSSLKEPPGANLKEPPGALAEPPGASPSGVKEPPGALKEPGAAPEPATDGTKKPPAVAAAQPTAKPVPAKVERTATPAWYWITLTFFAGVLAVLYSTMTFERLEVFKMLLSSFFPLAMLILAVLGTIVFGLATPTEAAAIGSFGGFVLAAVYMAIKQPPAQRNRTFKIWAPFWLVFLVSVIWFVLYQAKVVASGPSAMIGAISVTAIGVWCVLATWQVRMVQVVKESVFLTAKTSAMVCWLFVGSAIFSAAFALLGGQDIIEKWVLSLGLTPIQFLLLSQFIIFILGWPLEWTEIIVIFMPIFIPLLPKFGVDPLFFGLLVALNLQTAFLSPPVAMAAFYLKGVSPPHVTLNQIFAGMLPFMGIQVLALFLLYMFPGIGLWLPSVLYK
jgi:TRAP-type mannitol/chloroaromatic compound transport system permease large subunit